MIIYNTLMAYKNTAYSNNRRDKTRCDYAGSFYHSNQENKQDKLIKQWLERSNKADAKFEFHKRTKG